MTKEEWIPKIRRACEDAGTYRPYFDELICTLAGILERRDECEKQYAESGEGMTIERTNRAGFSTLVKNPAMVFYDDFCRTSLSYWKELGLTPAGLKKLKDETFNDRKEDKGSGLKRLLEAMQDA